MRTAPTLRQTLRDMIAMAWTVFCENQAVRRIERSLERRWPLVQPRPFDERSPWWLVAMAAIGTAIVLVYVDDWAWLASVWPGAR